MKTPLACRSPSVRIALALLPLTLRGFLYLFAAGCIALASAVYATGAYASPGLTAEILGMAAALAVGLAWALRRLTARPDERIEMTLVNRERI